MLPEAPKATRKGQPEGKRDGQTISLMNAAAVDLHPGLPFTEFIMMQFTFASYEILICRPLRLVACKRNVEYFGLV